MVRKGFRLLITLHLFDTGREGTETTTGRGPSSRISYLPSGSQEGREVRGATRRQTSPGPQWKRNSREPVGKQ